MKNLKSQLAAVVLLLLVASPVFAVVLDFEDIGGFSNRAHFVTLGLDTGYSGATWPTESGGEYWAVVENSDSQFATVGAYSGTQALWNWSDGGVRNIIFDSPSRVQGAYFNVFAAQQSWGADTVQFNAYSASGSLIGSSAVLNLDPSSANPAWQWLELGVSGVTRLEIISTNDGGDGWWSMDDLTFEPSQTEPVPSISWWGIMVMTFLLLITAFLGRKNLFAVKP